MTKHPSSLGFRFVYRYKVEGDAQDHAAALRREGNSTIVHAVHGYPSRPPYRLLFEVWVQQKVEVAS